jgi:hypothetical protein
MSLTLDAHWFVMIFRRELIVGLAPKTSSGALSIDGVEFASVDDNHLTAFVDRLTDRSGELVGVNISPVSDAAERLMLAVRSLPYVTSEPGAFQVWFSEAPLADACNNAEQAFGGQVFTSPTGDLALSIDAESLFTATDQERLTTGHATWARVLG